MSMLVEKHIGSGQELSAEMMFELGMKYSLGRGVERDMCEAHKWFNLAAMRGHEKARRYRMELSEELTPDELHEALARARKWLHK